MMIGSKSSDDEMDEKMRHHEENGDTVSTTRKSATTTSWLQATRPGHLCAPYSDDEASILQILSFTAIFFLSMISHDVALEAATTEFVSLKALPYAVTLFQFGFCLLLPLIISKAKGQTVKHDFPTTFVGIMPYICLSLIVFGATSLETISVRHVNYYTKAMFKSSKLISTLLFSKIIVPSTCYSWMEYVSAVLLCFGAAGFYLGGNNDELFPDGDVSTEGYNNTYAGVLLLSFSIILDGVAPNIQQNLMTPPQPQITESSIAAMSLLSAKSNKKELSASSLMVNMNTVGFGGCLIYMLVSGHLFDAIDATLDEPNLFMYLALAGSGLSIALMAYTKLIKTSGAVIAVAVATLRRVVAVLLSYAFFPNKKFSTIHLFSGLVLLLGIFINTYCGNNNLHHKQLQQKQQEHNKHQGLKRKPSDVDPEEIVELTKL